ncbi:SLC5 family protein [Rhodothermus marinus]|uniref:SLC5 family protein n=1 Tax=Rhodothermus marinus TaxID=29549 RepID=UPI000AE9CD0A|nr:sodium/solute symporter [Rhodothermus marinus]
MTFGIVDLIAFVGFIAFVIGFSLYASRKEETGEDYFLAGRGLTWWLIGFSLIASNISTEHFVGMAGRGFELGLAIASYEWMAAVTLVIVAFFFLPKFLRAGIYTMPEYLEYRYNTTARTIMATFMMLAYVFVALATVLYSGALALEAIFGLDTVLGIWLIGLLAGFYTVYGGLKAVVWTDLLQGAALLLGGLLVTVLGFQALGGVDVFFAQAGDKLHTVLPWDHPEMPWVAVFIGGLWIPNLFYWGLNQFITQRTLGARSLEEGQKGIMLAALLKLLIPFIIVFPGIMLPSSTRRK